MLTSELLAGAKQGLLTASEAQQLTSRFLILLEQALDLPTLHTGMVAMNPWDCASYRR